MKTAKFFVAAILAAFISLNMYGQQGATANPPTKKETIKVLGKCDMCKTRIEKAAKIDGVSSAVWDKKTNLLTVVYNPSKVSSDDIQKKEAAVGHDTEKYKADDKVYNSLPACCKYRETK